MRTVYVVLGNGPNKNGEGINVYSNLKKVWERISKSKLRISWANKGTNNLSGQKTVNTYATLHRLVINEPFLIIQLKTEMLTIYQKEVL